MRSSVLPRLLAIGLLLTLTTTACGLFAIQSEVGLKKVNVDLTFGANLEPLPTVTFPPPPPPATVPPIPTLDPSCSDGLDNDDDGLIDFPADPGCDNPTDDDESEPPPPLCGPTTATAAEDATVATMTYPDNVPEEGNYLFQVLGNFENEPFFNAFGHATISNIAQVGEGFEYTIADPITLMELTFQAQPISETDPVGDGLFISRIQLPEDRTSPQPRLLAFEPAQPIRVLEFPIEPGASVSGQQIDVAPKSTTPITNPVTGLPVLSPSGNAVRSSTKVEAPETVIVCEELGRAYKMNWDLQITGEFNVRILGTFWMATQYGGWPMRADYLVVGDLIPGNFISNLAKIDPGDYI